jgi:nicotinate-nucleotide--dimethylbenzimidazole phosphoribosyltransferase
MHTTIAELTERIDPIDQDILARARERTSRLIMPHRALGRLLDMAERVCAIRGTLAPSLAEKTVLVMAGDHGVVARGVSAYPQEVTLQMVGAFLAGLAGVNVLAGHAGASVTVVDMGVAGDLTELAAESGGRLVLSPVGKGTADFVRGPAMSREQAEQAVLAGYGHARKLFDAGLDVLAVGDMGIGNTTASAAVGAVLCGVAPRTMAGRGSGVDDEGLERKVGVVEQGIAGNRPDSADGLDVLAKVGGFEIGGIAGAILAAAACRRPVVVDGFIAGAGALVAASLQPLAREVMFAGHVSAEPGHRIMLESLGLAPILDLGMRLGEGSGAALAMTVLEGGLKAFREMKTFEEAGVSEAG